MRTLTLNDDEYLIPGDWNELTNDQLVYLARMVEKGATPESVKVKMLLYAMDAYVYEYKLTENGYVYHISTNKRKRYILTAEEMASITPIFDYLFKEVDGKFHIDPKLISNPFPETKCGCRTAYGPADGLTNITFEQFSDLQIWQTRVSESEVYLHKFISIIYKKHNGSDFDLKQIAKISPTVKICIVWFYIGCMAYLYKKFPKTFAGSGGEASTDVVDGQMRLLDALAQGKLVDKEQVKKSLLYDALYSMEVAAEKLEKMEAELAKQKR